MAFHSEAKRPPRLEFGLQAVGRRLKPELQHDDLAKNVRQFDKVLDAVGWCHAKIAASSSLDRPRAFAYFENARTKVRSGIEFSKFWPQGVES